LQNALPAIINKSNQAEDFYFSVGSLPNAETYRRKSEVRQKLFKVLWKAEN